MNIGIKFMRAYSPEDVRIAIISHWARNRLSDKKKVRDGLRKHLGFLSVTAEKIDHKYFNDFHNVPLGLLILANCNLTENFERWLDRNPGIKSLWSDCGGNSDVFNRTMAFEVGLVLKETDWWKMNKDAIILFRNKNKIVQKIMES